MDVFSLRRLGSNAALYRLAVAAPSDAAQRHPYASAVLSLFVYLSFSVYYLVVIPTDER